MRIKLFILLSFAGQLFGQSTPTLYVASPNGLSLREAPSKDSKRIQLMDYAAPISSYSIVADSWTTIDGYSGEWIKVTQNGKTGYVFNGYTLPFKVPGNGDLKEYFASVFGKMVFEDSIINRSDGDDVLDKHIYHFANGVIFMESYMYESNESTLMNLDLGPSQAYLFYYLLEGKHHLMSSINYPQQEIKNDSISIELNKYPCGSLYIEKTDFVYYWIRISWLSGSTVITWGSGV